MSRPVVLAGWPQVAESLEEPAAWQQPHRTVPRPVARAGLSLAAGSLEEQVAGRGPQSTPEG